LQSRENTLKANETIFIFHGACSYGLNPRMLLLEHICAYTVQRKFTSKIVFDGFFTDVYVKDNHILFGIKSCWHPLPVERVCLS
jgi:hypothetical protein